MNHERPAMRNPFRYFNSCPEVIRLAVTMYFRYPLSLRRAEDGSTYSIRTALPRSLNGVNSPRESLDRF